MSFWSDLGGEFVARRKRLHREMKNLAAPAEFALLGGVVLAVAAPAVARNGFADAPWGPMLPVVLAAGYLLLERRRQAALAGGAEAGEVESAFDQRAKWLFVAAALVGAATFAWALFKPPPKTFLPEEPPASATFDVNIAP